MDVPEILAVMWTLCLFTRAKAGPIVETAGGPVEGFTDHLTDNVYLRIYKDVDVFLGIPFAEPPTGQLRFANPEPKKLWEGTWNATYFRPICPQILPGRRSGKDEDCLYLNVYAAHPMSDLKPVMAWIHGGAYNAGAGGRLWYGGTPLAAFGDVIVVTLNYRLGPFGFLSTGDQSAPGNFGMMDQIMALQWIQDNISNFGGDPTQVTIFGQSAGATSIGLHLLSPLSQRLYKYAIMQSGSTLTPFAYTDDKERSRAEAYLVGEKLGCATTSSRVLISCLRTKSTSQILASSLSMIFLSAPVIDGVFLPDHPELLVQTGQFKRTNIIIGTNHDEGTAWALAAFPQHINNNEKPHMYRDLYDTWHGRYTYGPTNDVILKSIDQEYLNWKEVDNPEADYLDAFVAEITDQTFVAPADTLSRAFVTYNGGDVYLYRMTHVPSASVYELTSRDIGPGWLGVTHGEEFQFIFGWSFIPDISDSRPQLPPIEKSFTADVMSYWINFAKTGNPNTAGKPNWSRFTLPDMEYLKLEPGFPSDRALRADTCNFWNSYLPALVQFSGDVSSASVSSSVRRHGRYRRQNHTSWSTSSWITESIRRSHPQIWWNEILERCCERDMMILSALLVFCLVSFSWATGPIVMTASGPVQGFVDHLKESTYIGVDKDFDVFLGIPFAKPPVGDLRFANPEQPDPWIDTYEATAFRPSCPQPMFGTKDEDCLYLNVYAPSPKPQNAAVMVWFHGGAYNAGSSGRYMYSGIPLAAVGNVIVVTVNYRLGSLGFLSTGDNAAPGNFGSLDQVMALRWVQDNIAYFGGDPTRVTIFGESAGATSVGLHIVSRSSQDLFTWAIMQSGSTKTPFAYNSDSTAARNEAFQLGGNVGCDAVDSQELIACLRTKSADEILIGGLRFGFLSAPVVDGNFLTADPLEILERGDFKHRNILLGTNHDEGTLWALGIYPDYTMSKSAPFMSKEAYDEHRDDFLTGYLDDITLKAMDQQYIDWSKADDMDTDYLDLVVRQITDETFTAPADGTARAFYQHGAGDVYMYELTHVPSVPAYSYKLLGPGWLGVTHGEDLQFIFGWSFIPRMKELRRNLRSDELTFMVNMMTYWTNFAKTGTPNSAELPTWPTYTVPELEYMVLDPDLIPSRALRADDVAFWNTLVPELLQTSGLSKVKNVWSAPWKTF
ncbi:uncharacterized protein LOC129255582 [Lytechinus pictus]|uniref:uncharacterized protein LOC129255582 n=1 Tax=Lytechinus pictus TaxID=7653 RepID=UPI0030B9C17D